MGYLERQEIAMLTHKNKILTEELLRVRTTQAAAAHELDNIAIELGLGHSPKPLQVQEKVRAMAKLIKELQEEVNYRGEEESSER